MKDADYVPGARVLHEKVKGPLFDTLIIPETGGLYSVPLFTDCQWFPDHSPKVRGKHTNMDQNGCLPNPKVYELSSLEIHVEKFSHPDDLRRVMKQVHLQLVIGVKTYLEGPLSIFAPLLVTPGAKKDAVAAVERFSSDGAWLHYTHAVGPIRIPPLMMIACHVKAAAPIGELHGPVHLIVAMQDAMLREVM